MGSTNTEFNFFPIIKPNTDISYIIGNSSSSLKLVLSPVSTPSINNDTNIDPSATNFIISSNNDDCTNWQIPNVTSYKYLKINNTNNIFKITNITQKSIYGCFIDINSKNRNAPINTPYPTAQLLNDGIQFGNILPKDYKNKLLSGTTNVANYNTKLVQFFSKEQLGGDSVSFKIGIYNNNNLPFSVKSIYVPKDTLLTIFDELSFTGKQIQLKNSKDMNNTTDLSKIYYIDNNNVIAWGDRPVKSWIVCKIPSGNEENSCGSLNDPGITNDSSNGSDAPIDNLESQNSVSESFGMNDMNLKWYVTTNGKMVVKKSDANTISIINKIQKYGTFSLHNLTCNMADAELIGENILLTVNGVEESGNDIWVYFTPNINIREYCSATISTPASNSAITTFNEILNAGPTSLLIDNNNIGISDTDIPFSHDMNLLTFDDTSKPASLYEYPPMHPQMPTHNNDIIFPTMPYIDEATFRPINDSQALQDSQGLSRGNALYNSRIDSSAPPPPTSQMYNYKAAPSPSKYKQYNYEYEDSVTLLKDKPSNILYSWRNIIVYIAIILIIIILIYLIINI